MKLLLLLDDDAIFRKRLAQALVDRQYAVTECPDASLALEHLAKNSFDGIICDLKMPNMSGLEFLEEAQKSLATSLPPVVMLTGHGSVASAVAAMKLGCVHYLKKPATADCILASLFPSKTADPSVLKEELSLKEVEREHIEHVLHQHDGNITRAAKELGLHRRSLQRKLS